jgi:hypothetical protein
MLYRIKHLLVLSFVLVMALTFSMAAAPTPTSSAMTVGDFAVMIASKLQPTESATVPTTEAALQKLTKAGINLKADPTATLTAGDAAEIFRQLGITIQAEHPESPLVRDRAQTLVNTFADTFSSRSPQTPSSTTVRGTAPAQGSAMAGLEALEDCQSLPKNKDCHECCQNLGLGKNICGKACSNGKKASGSEPTP